MATKSPFVRMQSEFGEKAKLVEAVKKFTTDDLWLPRTRADRGGTKGIEHVSNAKLLRLHRTFTEVKEKFGTRAKLIDAILDLEKRAKDAGLRKRLEAYPVPRLYDLWRSTAKRTKADGAPVAAEGATKKKAAAAPKAKAAASPKKEKAPAEKKPRAKKTEA